MRGYQAGTDFFCKRFDLRLLGLPEAEGGLAALVRSDAGRLFVDRAARATPAFELTPRSAAGATSSSAVTPHLTGGGAEEKHPSEQKRRQAKPAKAK